MKKLLFILIPFLVIILLFIIIAFFLPRGKDKGALQVTSDPTSKVYLNGKSIGQSPLCKCALQDMIETGEYTIKLVPTTGNSQPFEQKITISSKVLTVVHRNFGQSGLESGHIITLMSISDKKSTQISVISFPDAVQVFLDNSLQGQSPILLKNVTQSDHELKLAKEGYKDKIVNIRTVLGFKLEALVFMGLDPNIATQSATPVSSKSAALSTTKVLILETPTGFLRVREDATLGAAEIAQVKPGEIYDLLDEKTGWLKIKLKDGNQGWVSSQYAQKQN